MKTKTNFCPQNESQTETGVHETDAEMGDTWEMPLIQMMFGNNSVQETLEGERKTNCKGASRQANE